MAKAANLGGIGRRGLLEIVAAAKAARVVMIVVPAAVVKVEEDRKDGTKAGPVEAVDVPLRDSRPRSSWRS
jgi:hypothetical protein